MPLLKRPGQPALHYVLEDYTDAWRPARTVLMQHGFGRSGRFWYGWVPHLARRWRVVRPDLRGLGKSPVDFDPKTGISVENYVADLVALLDHLEIDAVHYCGESFGGILGMLLAALHPDRVRTLTLVSAPVSLNEKHKATFAAGHESREAALRAMGVKQWAAATNGTTRFPPGTDPKLCEWYAAEMGKSDVEVLCALYGVLRTATAEPYLSRITAPVLGLYPQSGPITSDEQMALLRQGIPHMKVVHLPTQFHSILTTHADACAEQMLAFVSEHDGAAAEARVG